MLIPIICLFMFLLSWLRVRGLEKTLCLASTTFFMSTRHKPGSDKLSTCFSPNTLVQASFLPLSGVFSPAGIEAGWCGGCAGALFVSGCKVYASPVTNRLERVRHSNRYLREKRRKTGVELPEENK